jgi:hypothetical protein
MSDVSPSSSYEPAPEVEDGRETMTRETNELPLANSETVVVDAVPNMTTDGSSRCQIEFYCLLLPVHIWQTAWVIEALVMDYGVDLRVYPAWDELGRLHDSSVGPSPTQQGCIGMH